MTIERRNDSKPRDPSLAEQGAIRERMLLADALVTVRIIREADNDARLAEAAGVEIEVKLGTRADY